MRELLAFNISNCSSFTKIRHLRLFWHCWIDTSNIIMAIAAEILYFWCCQNATLCAWWQVIQAGAGPSWLDSNLLKCWEFLNSSSSAYAFPAWFGVLARSMLMFDIPACASCFKTFDGSPHGIFRRSPQKERVWISTTLHKCCSGFIEFIFMANDRTWDPAFEMFDPNIDKLPLGLWSKEQFTMAICTKSCLAYYLELLPPQVE